MKYTLTEKRILFRGRELFQIRRSDGVLGGYVESEKNLSQYSGCWVFLGGRVFGDAIISGNAEVFGVVYGTAEVGGNSVIGENASVPSGIHHSVEIV